MRSMALLAVLCGTTFVHAQMQPAQVVVAPVEQRAVQRTQPLVASAEPVTRSTLAAEEGGLVAERHFDEGQRVSKGALLARTKTDLLEMQLSAAGAVRDSAEAMLERAQADADHATRELARIRKLQSQGVGSEKEIDDAISSDRVGKAMVAVRTAELAEKEAEVSRLKLLISKSQVYSPFEGMIQRRYVEVGQWIQQGDPVADLVQLDPLFVRMNVPENVIAFIQPGDEAVVTFDALRGREFRGKVDQVLPEADPVSRTFAVKILLPNPKYEIRPGFFARAVLLARNATSGFVVPADAIVSRGDEAHVVAARNGQAVIVPVQRVLSESGKVVVNGELKPDDVLVVRGNENLRPGQPLIIQNAPPAQGQAPPQSATAR